MRGEAPQAAVAAASVPSKYEWPIEVRRGWLTTLTLLIQMTTGTGELAARVYTNDT